jgi:hypothetical protein
MGTKKSKSSKVLRILPGEKAESQPEGRGSRQAVEHGKSHPDEATSNVRAARSIWGPLSRLLLKNLREITKRHHLSVSAGDVTLLGSQLYITHAGLLRIGKRNRCSGIVTRLHRDLSDPAESRWVFRATVFKSPRSKGFDGYGDADPSNTSPLVRGAEMRVAETRAVNRALRKAYGIGLCSVEELGWLSSTPSPTDNRARPSKPCASNGSNNGRPRLRDQLCLLIRKYELDPTLVKRYAADFCGTEALRDASRDLVEAFISSLADEAVKDRAALICKLNSYNQLEEVKS